MKHLVWKLVTNILDEPAAPSSAYPEDESDRFHRIVSHFRRWQPSGLR